MRKLTGKYRIRKTLFGWQIKVQVYKQVCDFVGDESPDIKVWRRARVEDLIETEGGFDEDENSLVSSSLNGINSSTII